MSADHSSKAADARPPKVGGGLTHPASMTGSASALRAGGPVVTEYQYAYRAASDVLKWYHRRTEQEARADLPQVSDDPSARWVERRAPWERVP